MQEFFFPKSDSEIEQQFPQYEQKSFQKILDEQAGLRKAKLCGQTFSPVKMDGRCTVVTRFKLDSLENKNLRYEVIYKNLLRDMRKFYLQEFNEATDFCARKKKTNPDFYLQCVKAFVKLNKIHTPQDQIRGVTEEQIAFNLARFIYPKELNKNEFGSGSKKSEEIYCVYESLYKFSLQKLNLFTIDACLNRMFVYYF